MGRRSVLDVKGVAEGLVEPDAGFEVELSDAFCVEERGGNRYQVVAGYDALFGKTLGRADFNFGADAPDGSGDRGAGDRGEDGDGGVAGEDADGPPAGQRP